MIASNDASQSTEMIVDIKGWFIEENHVNAIKQVNGSLDVAYVFTEGINQFWVGEPSEQSTPESFRYQIKNANIKANQAISLVGQGSEIINGDDYWGDYCGRLESDFASSESPFESPALENIHLRAMESATPDAPLEPMIQVNNATLKVRGLSIERGDIALTEGAQLIASELNLMDSTLQVSAGTELALYKANMSKTGTALITNDGGDVRIRSARLSAPTFLASAPRAPERYTSELCDIVFTQTRRAIAFDLSGGHEVTAHNTSVSLKGGRLAELTSGGHLTLSKSTVASTEPPTGLGRMLRAHRGGALSMSDVTVNAYGLYPRLMLIDDSSLLALDKTALYGIDQSGLMLVPTLTPGDGDALTERPKTLNGVHLEYQTTEDLAEVELRSAILIAPDATSVVSGPSSEDIDSQPVSTDGRLVVGLPLTTDGDTDDQLDGLSDLFTCHDGIYTLDCSIDPSSPLCPRATED